MNDENSNRDRWEATLLGESMPDSEDPVAKKAHTVRQIILWKDAQNVKDVISPYQASVVYRRVYRSSRKKFWLKYSLFGVLFLAIMLTGWYLIDSPLINKKNGATHLNHQNLVLQDIESASSEMPYMINLPAGNFTMGCENGWDDKLGSCSSVEKPPHDEEVAAFAIAKFETTVGQFKKFVAETGYVTTAELDNAGCTIRGKDIDWVLSKDHNWKNPGFEQTDLHPVVCMSWVDAKAYTSWLSKTTGLSYRLPTEVEWEYAARSKEFNAFYWGDAPDRHFANYRGVGEVDSWEYAAPVGKFGGNNFLLHDMAGNAWEWVDSCWTVDYNSECEAETEKVRRGGSFFDSPRNIRHAYRSHDVQGARSFLYGFRVAHDL